VFVSFDHLLRGGFDSCDPDVASHPCFMLLFTLWRECTRHGPVSRVKFNGGPGAGEFHNKCGYLCDLGGDEIDNYATCTGKLEICVVRDHLRHREKFKAGAALELLESSEGV